MAWLARAPRATPLILLLLFLLLTTTTAATDDAPEPDDGPDRNEDAPPRPMTPPGPEPAHARRQVREHQVDADDGLHQQQSWMLSEYAPFAIFPDVARFYVRRWTSATTSWISPNCPASSLPSPPSRIGPSACACPGSSGEPESVYGQMEIEHLWTWCADWRDLVGRETGFQRLFIPDIWNGQGPCPRFTQTSVLHRMPNQVVQAGNWFRIDPRPRAMMEDQEDIDNTLIPSLFRGNQANRLPELDRAVFQGAPSLQLLTEAWASWVQSVLERRGYIVMELVWNLAHSWLSVGRPDLWERLRNMRYFGASPLGAWFDRTLESAGTIRRLIRLGVPVYYRWDDGEHGGYPELADLRPRAPPRDEAQGVVMPPLSPHRPGHHAERFYHRYSHRSPVRSAFATTLDGRPLHVSREEMAYLTDNDPAARPPPLRFQDTQGSSPVPGPSRRRARSTRRASQASSASRPDLDSSSQASGASKKGSLASRLSSPPPNTRSPVPDATHTADNDDASWEFVFGETHERALRAYEADAHAGLLPHHEDRVAFAIQHGMAFNTGRERVIEAVDGMDTDNDADVDILMTAEVEVHNVEPSLAIAETTPLADRYTTWEAGARAILARPHGRAAIMRGGLIARIAVELGMTERAVMFGPSANAFDIPNDHAIQAPGGRTLIDDYLSDSEVAIILGQVGFRGDSLWPDEATFRSNGWEGVWTGWHEAWFTETLALLRNPEVCPTSRRDQWRSTMRHLRYKSSTAPSNNA
ncbi:hypothetical protein EXIGLDRAFT_780015 [Exidia glandulosa HHB12029]|uniref:Uncharacterized protein n=1 Tax=Exidia glandulosa HHB12029 TaxID=1314781 RepID=A0A165BSG1_EXIGL|nr:hypothetical protein EXIGLDRAFT_780015 [Exidia glandulosa HHB12029]